MPEGLAAALGAPGFALLCIATLAGGLIYGFAGFGSALIFMPLATAFVPPGEAVLLMALFGLSSAFTVLPQAWREAERRPTLLMIAAAVAALPAGFWLLSSIPADPLRWSIAVVTGLTLAALIAGWRYEARPGPASRIAVGAASGVVGGATGLTGPIVILFHLGGPGGAAVTRANTITFLTLLGMALIPGLLLQGFVSASVLWLALPLVPLYMIGTRGGKALFRPGAERVYRRIAFGVIALAVLAGLPVWD